MDHTLTSSSTTAPDLQAPVTLFETVLIYHGEENLIHTKPSFWSKTVRHNHVFISYSSFLCLSAPAST
ncbi:hypothetical protein ILYODFUR_000075, partial [Ilyodon furcidens]